MKSVEDDKEYEEEGDREEVDAKGEEERLGRTVSIFIVDVDFNFASQAQYFCLSYCF